MNRSRHSSFGLAGARRRVIYILAASHSGSTLLAMLLASHPEVCTVGELKLTSLDDPERYTCSCLRLIRECPFWKDVGQEMRRRGFAVEVTDAGTDFAWRATPFVSRLLRPLHRGPLLERLRDFALFLSPAWRSRLPELQARNAALIDSLCTLTGNEIVVDSSKIGLRLKYLLRNPALDVRVIRLIRDGRAVALTYTDPARFADARDPHLRGGGIGGTRVRECLPLETAAREWRRSNEEAEEIVQGLERSRWVEVRYETVCSEPEVTLRQLFTFIGVNPDAPRMDLRSVGHHIVGNGMRLDWTGDVRLDERWRSALSVRDLRTFDTVAGAMNRTLGYH